MSASRRTFLITAIFLTTSFACVLPSISASSTDAISTAAAQTVIAGLTQNAPQEVSTAEVPPTLPPTITSESIILTPSLTATLTFTPLPIFTNTSSAPLMSVSVPTNCRNGPGKAYNREGSLLVGETAEVFGRDPTNQYWYIRNPDPGTEFCWAWGKYATISGSPLLLPVFTPPPTPTPTMTATPAPSFDLEFTNADSCSGWWMDILVKNTGLLPFKSVTINVKDDVTEVELIANSDGFTDLDGCLKTSTKDVLSPGDTFIISSLQFNYNPNGHNIRAFITLCTEKGQNGGCVTRKINFNP